MIPSRCALRSLLALKLFGTARHRHVMSAVLDEGLALFAGLNVIPKRSFLTEYSCRIDPAGYPELMRRWFDAVSRLGLHRGHSFDLDFHTIPFHGEDALIEKHYVSKRSRRQKGILAFVAQDADTRVFCYANGDLRKDKQNDEILPFVNFWKGRTGKLSRGADLRLQIDDLCQPESTEPQGVRLHHAAASHARSLMRAIDRLPASAWRRIELKGVSRQYKHPRILDQRTALSGLRRPGAPADRHRPGSRGADDPADQPADPVGGQVDRALRPADDHREHDRRRHRLLSHGCIVLGGGDEGQLRPATDADGQQLVPLAGGRDRQRLRGAESRHLFQDFVNATADVTVSESEIVVRYQKRAHNPLLIAAGWDTTETAIPWLGRKRLRLVFG